MRPKAIYYNWADYPVGNIYGENNLPVLPFRSDQMQLVGMEGVKAGKPATLENVYSSDGVLIRQNVDDAQSAAGLPKGIYIMGNKKKLVK